MSSEQAKALVQKLVEAGEWPEPALLDEILAQGQEAVEPLLQVVRSRPHGWPAEAPLNHAVILLCILCPPEAVPALVDLLRAYPNATAEVVSENAGVYGAAIVEAALGVTRDAGLSWYSRSAAAELAVRAAGKDVAVRARVVATLRELLRQQLALAPRYRDAFEESPGTAGEKWSEDDPAGEAGRAVPPPGSADDHLAMTTTLVADLASLADPEARKLIGHAFAADLVDTWMIDKKEVARSYREEPREPGEADPRAALERYRTDFENHRAGQRRRPLELLSPRRPLA